MSEEMPWPMPIKLEMCDYGLSIHAYYEDRAPHKLFDIRGWGHLTGGGACNLDEKTAESIQRQLGKAVCDAWNTRTPNTEALEVVDKIERIVGGALIDRKTGEQFSVIELETIRKALGGEDK